MLLKNILEKQSEWTWDIMMATAQLGEMIREDAITSVNLATINELAKGNLIELNITSLQGSNIEKEYGADWFWNANNKNYLVQAKRLDVVKKLQLMSYRIEIEQLKQLTNASTVISEEISSTVTPVYVFYNSFLKEDERKKFGCMYMNANLLLEEIIKEKKDCQQSVTLLIRKLLEKDLIHPWDKMFD